jgi:hypothetical protein
MTRVLLTGAKPFNISQQCTQDGQKFDQVKGFSSGAFLVSRDEVFLREAIPETGASFVEAGANVRSLELPLDGRATEFTNWNLLALPICSFHPPIF